MFKKNKNILDKCSIRVYNCGIRTKHKTITQEGKQNEDGKKRYQRTHGTR